MILVRETISSEEVLQLIEKYRKECEQSHSYKSEKVLKDLYNEFVRGLIQ